MPPRLSNRSVAAQGVFALSQTIFAALYPPRCAGCDAFCEALFCASCRATLQIAPPISDAKSPAREYSLIVPEREEIVAPALETRAALLFDGATRTTIHKFKYEGRTALAAPLAQLMLETLQVAEDAAASTRSDFAPAKSAQDGAAERAETSPQIFAAKRHKTSRAAWQNQRAIQRPPRAGAARANNRAPFSDEDSQSEATFLSDDAPLIFVPIPLHAWRKWRRGYNQSELLARELARLSDAPCVSLLRRTRYTVTQTELSREERTENVRGAFALNENALRVLATRSATHIVLIDDVYTTGATLQEAARVLREAFPAAKVSALTLAYRPSH